MIRTGAITVALGKLLKGALTSATPDTSLVSQHNGIIARLQRLGAKKVLVGTEAVSVPV